MHSRGAYRHETDDIRFERSWNYWTTVMRPYRSEVKRSEVRSLFERRTKVDFEICKLVELRNVTYRVRNIKCGGWGGTRRWRDCVFACVMLSAFPSHHVDTNSWLSAKKPSFIKRLSKFTGDFLERMVRCNDQCCKVDKNQEAVV